MQNAAIENLIAAVRESRDVKASQFMLKLLGITSRKRGWMDYSVERVRILQNNLARLRHKELKEPRTERTRAVSGLRLPPLTARVHSARGSL